jgi:hypothetical protein
VLPQHWQSIRFISMKIKLPPKQRELISFGDQLKMTLDAVAQPSKLKCLHVALISLDYTADEM